MANLVVAVASNRGKTCSPTDAGRPKCIATGKTALQHPSILAINNRFTVICAGSAIHAARALSF
jgi:hypothetical protein